ncbi:MFS transporter [Candidatus Finniella inopinata]|uniref:MFS transporter n=2 Tax=Candidatus Finniella inopinata TaxID=1696036 RepID=A0A4V2DZJ6_9PROT|nr:MFS transporter [Candidatus Finniella inopinata]
MLYVHMAVLLNELFFPETDPHTASLIAALAFCSTYVLRPFGALLFGWIGDNIGRKTTVILTTMMMSVSCLIMANLPTYAQIGITAAWLVTACRIIQGLSSMGEIIGAQIYVSEVTVPPGRYVGVAALGLASSIGGMAALGLASLVTHFSMSWRIGFWAGAGIAVIGSLARTRLRETPEFVDMKRKKRLNVERSHKNDSQKTVIIDKFNLAISNTQIPKQRCFASFCIECGQPFMFYLTYIYFNPILKSFGYSSSDIIFHNFFLSVFTVFCGVLMVFLCLKVYPLKILKFRMYCFIPFVVVLPFLILRSIAPWQILCLQMIIIMFPVKPFPADAIFMKSFPVQKRFTINIFINALSRAWMHLVAAFGLVYLTEWFGYYGIWVIAFPLIGAFFWGVRHFEKLESLHPGNDSQKQTVKYERVA